MNIISYKDSGVDIELGDDTSRIMFKASQSTWKNRSDSFGKIISESGHFGTLRYINTPDDKDLVLGLNSDGVGTKIELAERLGKHDSIAFDLFAMVCDDAAIRGAEPVLVTSVLDVNSLDIEIVRQLADGMKAAAKESRVCVINGEIAELGIRVGGFGQANYNWSATVLWIARKSKLLKQALIKPGTKILAINEKGIRSNGLSLVRRIMEHTYGKEWHKHPEGREILKWALIPSNIYTSFLVKLHGGYLENPTCKILGAIHVTGGGIPGKLGRILSQVGLGANLDNLFQPSKYIHTLQRLGNVPDEECYRTWNMGQGLLILSDEIEPIEKVAKKMGYEVCMAGTIIEDNHILIKSKGLQKPDSILKFALK